MEKLEIFVEGEHEYSYTKDTDGHDVIHTLYYSNNESWQEPYKGKECCTIEIMEVDIK